MKSKNKKMLEHIIESDNFYLNLTLDVIESNIGHPICAVIKINVTSNGFSAQTDFDIDIKQFAEFCVQLQSLYETLNGSSSIKEFYGYQRYISFTAGKSGHITVKGYLCDNSQDNKLHFENTIDQTYLRCFVSGLSSTYSKYKLQMI